MDTLLVVNIVWFVAVIGLYAFAKTRRAENDDYFTAALFLSFVGQSVGLYLSHEFSSVSVFLWMGTVLLLTLSVLALIKRYARTD